MMIFSISATEVMRKIAVNGLVTHKKEHMIIFKNPLFPFLEDQEVNPWFLLIG